MGQLVVQEFVTADGFAANTNNEFTAYEMLEGGTAEFDRSQLAWLDTVDAMVLGAATYRMFAEFWPTPASDGEVIAPALNGLRRFVFSRTLKNAPWGDLPAATVESGDAVEAIRRIKLRRRGHRCAVGQPDPERGVLRGRRSGRRAARRYAGRDRRRAGCLPGRPGT